MSMQQTPYSETVDTHPNPSQPVWQSNLVWQGIVIAVVFGLVLLTLFVLRPALMPAANSQAVVSAPQAASQSPITSASSSAYDGGSYVDYIHPLQTGAAPVRSSTGSPASKYSASAYVEYIHPRAAAPGALSNGIPDMSVIGTGSIYDERYSK